ncbi:hypothetical protein RHECNPAF_122100195 [Rhizobium etli CNPAF512]|nr:hypothetical protein RHECNPAF_122100195 [Rhizobium etli CNPAF512]
MSFRRADAPFTKKHLSPSHTAIELRRLELSSERRSLASRFASSRSVIISPPRSYNHEVA